MSYTKKGRTIPVRTNTKMKNTATANKLSQEFINATNPKPAQKRTISGTQFKAVQQAVKSAVSDMIPESTTRAVTQAAVYGIKPGQRSELLLQVEAEKIVDARHVEVKLIDGGNRRYVWLGTTGQAARLKPGQIVLIKASAIGMEKDAMQIKHCRIVEVG